MTKEKRGLLIIFFSLLLVGLFFTQNNMVETLEKNLSFHMIVEHLIFFIAGISLVLGNELLLRLINRSMLFSLKEKKQKQIKSNNFSSFLVLKTLLKKWKSLLQIIFLLNRYPILWIIIAIILMVFWHIPIYFDFSALDNFTHILQHISFMVVDVSIFLAIRNFGESFTLILLISLIGMMGLAGLFFSVINDNIYMVYDIKNHNEAGFYMVLTSLVILILIFPIYLIKRGMIYINFFKQKSS